LPPSAALGHADLNTTLGIYGHRDQTDLETAMDAYATWLEQLYCGRKWRRRESNRERSQPERSLSGAARPSRQASHVSLARECARD